MNIWHDIIGLDPVAVKELPDQKVKIAFLKIGEMHIELLEATCDDSPIARFIEKKGEGLHHISIEVENIEGILRRLKLKGIRLIDQEPRIGAMGKRIAFIHPEDTGGVLIELTEA